jgi:hypothetical protein
MTSTIKVNNIQNQCGANIINESSNTITLGASGDNIALASGATQTGFGRTGTVDWITTPKTTGTFTAVSGEGYFLNTSGGVITANLPAGVAGAIVSFADYAATWQTSAVTVVPNGTDKIGGTNASATLSTEGQSVTFVFIDSTQGWLNTMDSTSNVRGASFVTATVSGACNTLTTVDTNFKVAKFVGPGTFCVSAAGNVAGSNKLDYLVVAGGASGAGGCGGGGGAGGFREAHNACTSGSYTASPLATPVSLTASVSAFPITVGAGGAGAPIAGSPPGNAGSNSVFSSITSAGGGIAGGGPNANPGIPGSAGGSGGAGNPRGEGGAGNTPPVSPPQGNAGGNGVRFASPNPQNTGGGGGGAGSVGSNGTQPVGGTGGNGATTSISGSAVTTTGGGGGGAGNAGPSPANCGPTAGPGCAGAGGYPGLNSTSATVNTGSGGGGSGASGTSGAGGSGIVYIRYKFQ